ncbi:MAG: hypothetical protein MJA31_17130, partial [Clostridia bacterium]|nr:hypothetical protein [Clostridia bacterium]
SSFASRLKSYPEPQNIHSFPLLSRHPKFRNLPRGETRIENKVSVPITHKRLLIESGGCAEFT